MGSKEFGAFELRARRPKKRSRHVRPKARFDDGDVKMGNDCPKSFQSAARAVHRAIPGYDSELRRCCVPVDVRKMREGMRAHFVAPRSLASAFEEDNSPRPAPGADQSEIAISQVVGIFDFFHLQVRQWSNRAPLSASVPFGRGSAAAKGIGRIIAANRQPSAPSKRSTVTRSARAIVVIEKWRTVCSAMEK
uniref:Uncharacterized protein n=1 Tax=Trichuris muris TaxID=70415 RepID=A0A5S6R4R6_TRIMR